jgi:hypothetical protein
MKRAATIVRLIALILLTPLCAGVVGMFPVTRDCGRIIEYDCLLVRAGSRNIPAEPAVPG